MNRNQKVLKHVNKQGCGIEIGPSIRPIAPKSNGFNVEIIDHASQEDLKIKYEKHNVDISNIEEVDFVWSGEKYSKLTNKKKHYDWLIASHLIEHTPDLVEFINNCEEILNANGVISLVIPDKRYCFDHYRPLTGLSQVVDGHLQKRTIHTPGSIAEYYLNVVSKNNTIAWNKYVEGEYKFIHEPTDATRGMNSVLLNNKYIDIHAWCFTPHSFRLLINDLNFLGLINFKELDFYPTEGCEFYITLSKHGKNLNKSRLELLEIIDLECQYLK
ncbi:MAG: methyltransferase domain-containing protein [Alcanivoracaceae bacterium]|nr:methyltransferase domain-containing protein [Alcanivoracaceae bacterium]